MVSLRNTCQLPSPATSPGSLPVFNLNPLFRNQRPRLYNVSSTTCFTGLNSSTLDFTSITSTSDQRAAKLAIHLEKMAEMRDQYGNPLYPTVDQYGNPVVPTAVDQYGNPLYQIDQYGNPITQPYGQGQQQQSYTGMGTTGTTTRTSGTEQVVGGQAQMMPENLYVGEGQWQQGLQRTGSSSSSSSSEDDGQGGRRRKKKGLKEKIKEKIPGMGGHKAMGPSKQQYSEGHREGMAAATGMTGHEEHGHAQVKEKKGVMEKIKEKMTGQHGH